MVMRAGIIQSLFVFMGFFCNAVNIKTKVLTISKNRKINLVFLISVAETSNE